MQDIHFAISYNPNCLSSARLSSDFLGRSLRPSASRIITVNIASSMHLALSTVKVHVHNILQKTGQPNRQALAQDFWKMS